MFYNRWTAMQIAKLKITRTEFCDRSGIAYSTLSQCKKYDPRLENLLLFCEVLTEEQKGTVETFEALIMEAIRNTKGYKHSAERISTSTEDKK